MSTKMFEDAWWKMVDCMPLQDVYRKFDDEMYDTLWFEWALQRPPGELFDRVFYMAEMFKKGEFLTRHTPEEVAALLISACEGDDMYSHSKERAPAGSMWSEDVENMVRAIVKMAPGWLSYEVFEGHDGMHALLDYIRWEQGTLPANALTGDAFTLLVYRWLTRKEFKGLDGASELLSSTQWASVVGEVLTTYAPKKIVWSRAEPFQGELDVSRTFEVVRALSFSVGDMPQHDALMRKLFKPHLEALPDLFVERFAGSRDFSMTLVQYMVLVLADMLSTQGVKRSETFHLLVFECMRWVSDASLLPLLRRVCEAEVDGLDEALERAAKGWFVNLSLTLADLSTSPERVWQAAISHALRTKIGYSERSQMHKLALIDGAFFRDTLHAQWQSEPPSKDRALVMLKVLEAQAHADTARLYVLALEHKSKPVREHALKAIWALGELARPVLDAHKDAKKKAVRDGCQRALAALDLPEDASSEEELAERARKLDRVERLVGKHDKLNAFLDGIMDDFIPWFEVLMEMYVPRARDYQVEQMVRGCVSYARQHHPRPEMWAVYVGALAHIDVKMRVYEKKAPLRPLASHMPDGLVDEVFAPVLLGDVKTLAENLYTYYFTRSTLPRMDVVVAGLEHASKPVRKVSFEHATQMMSTASAEQASAWLAVLSPLLTSKQKHARELTARLFALAATAELAPYVDALTTARDRERSADALDAFDAALSAAGHVDGAAEVSLGDEGASGDASWSDAQALLEAQRARKVPSFINLEALPELCWAETGAPISEKALKALLTTLRQEGPDSQDDIARQVRPWLDDASAHAFSIALKDQWMQAGSKPAHKWAPYQQGIFVTEERLNEFGPHLANWVSAGRHHWARWYMDVLARHGSQTGKSWVVHWALNAEHRSLHEHATQLVEQLATQAGVTPGELRLSANLYIAQDAYESSFPTMLWEQEPKATLDGGEVIEFVLDARGEFMIKRANDKLQKSLPKGASAEIKAQFKSLRDRVKRIDRAATRHLEECMISGRPWSKQAFEAFCVQNPVIARLSDRLLFMLEGGELFHIHEGDIIDVEWEPKVLPEDQTIRIAHMYDLEGKNVDKWLAHMGEGDVVQPFAQLDRPFFKHGDEPEVGEVSLATLAGRLLDGGWRHASAEDAGMVYEASKIWPGRGVRVTISHDGIYAGNPGMYREPTVVHLGEFVDLTGARIDAGDVDPIGYSETWIALCELTR